MSDDRFTVRRFSDDFARILRERILSGELTPGDRLNEVKLAAHYGISRSPIREALQALSGEGLVTFVPGRGAFVGGLTVVEIREIGQIREALESYAVRLVATSATPEQLDGLAKSVDVIDHAGDNDPECAQRDFHAEVLRLAGNGRLEQHAATVATLLRAARSRSATIPGRVDNAAQEHQVILEALRLGDVDAAADAMQAHIRKATDNACAAMEATEERPQPD